MTVTDAETNRIRDELVALTRDLMLIPTTASRPEEIRRGFQLIKNHLEGIDQLEIHEYEDKGVPSLVVLPKGIREPEILIATHMDVVDYPSPAVFTSRVREGRIWGPGAGDMKGCLAIALEILRLVHKKKKDASLGLVITSDEEVGGASGIGFLVEQAGLRCATAMVPDGGSLNSITTHERGSLHLRLRASGHYCHASRPWEGENALLLLNGALQRLETLFGEMKEQDHHWYPTCSPTMIKTSNEVINRIPDTAEGFIDVRFPLPFTSEEMVRRIKQTAGSKIEIEILISAEPTELRPDKTFFEVTENITGERAEEVKDHGGSDARFFAARGIPVIISRPLVGNLHSEEEWIDIDSMIRFYRIYEQYIARRLGIP